MCVCVHACVCCVLFEEMSIIIIIKKYVINISTVFMKLFDMDNKTKSLIIVNHGETKEGMLTD